MDTVLDHSPVSAFTVDLEDRMTAWNAAAALYFDVPAATALGGRFRDLDISYLVPGLRAAVEAMKREAGTDVVSLGTVRFVRRTGVAAAAAFTVAPIVRSGVLVGICVWAEDRVDRQGLEATIVLLSGQLTGLAGEHEELQTLNEELRTSQEQLQEVCAELERANDPLVGSAETGGRGVGLDGAERGLARDNSILRNELGELRSTHAALLGTLRQLQAANRRLRERLKMPLSA
jgi:hypothetical protein